MQSVTMAALVGAAITFLAGLFATLFALRWIGKKPGVDPIFDARFARVRPWLRGFGPMMMILAVVLLIVDTPRSSVPVEWRTATTSDGLCSIDMPGTPTSDTEPLKLKGISGRQTQRLHLVAENGQVLYSLGCFDFEGDAPTSPPEKILNEMCANWVQVAEREGDSQLVSERNLTANGWPAKQIVLDLNDQRMRGKWLLVKRKLYVAFVATPRDDKYAADADRFLDSFHPLKKPDDDSKGS
jgi:hypothetical protein